MTNTVSIETTVEVNGEEIDVEIRGSFMRGSRSYNYYVQDDMPEADIHTIKRLDTGAEIQSDALSQDTIDRILNKLIEQGQEEDSYALEKAMEWRRDSDN